MNRQQLLDFAAHVESCGADDETRIVDAIARCATADFSLDAAAAAAFRDALAGAAGARAAAPPLGILFELGQRIVPDIMKRGIAVTGPSEQLPSDFAGRWTVKFDGVRFGQAGTFCLAFAAALCRVAATLRDERLRADMLRQRVEAAAEASALRRRMTPDAPPGRR